MISDENMRQQEAAKQEDEVAAPYFEVESDLSKLGASIRNTNKSIDSVCGDKSNADGSRLFLKYQNYSDYSFFLIARILSVPLLKS